jgi:hypothetical protein
MIKKQEEEKNNSSRRKRVLKSGDGCGAID